DSAPSRRHRPEDGLTRPRRHLIVVVFPAPFGPRKPNTPPSGTARSSRSTARVVPPRRRRYSLRRASTSMTAPTVSFREKRDRPPPSRAGRARYSLGRRRGGSGGRNRHRRDRRDRRGRSSGGD